MEFNTEVFTSELTDYLTSFCDSWINKKDNQDIYIISIDISDSLRSIGLIANTLDNLNSQSRYGDDDYFYYKYCEDEWEIYDTSDEISKLMDDHITNNYEKFHESSTDRYSDAFYKYGEIIVDSCVDTLKIFKAKYPDVIFNVNMRDTFDEDERIRIFSALNDDTSVKEYSEHIEDFA